MISCLSKFFDVEFANLLIQFKLFPLHFPRLTFQILIIIKPKKMKILSDGWRKFSKSQKSYFLTSAFHFIFWTLNTEKKTTSFFSDVFFDIYFMAILFHSDLANCCTLRYWILQIQLMHYNFKYFLIKINKQNTHKIDLTVIRSCKKFL